MQWFFRLILDSCYTLTQAALPSPLGMERGEIPFSIFKGEGVGDEGGLIGRVR